MKTNKGKKSSVRFFSVLSCVVLLWLFAVAAGLSWLNGYLQNYDKTQALGAAKQTLQSHYGKDSAAALLTASHATQSVYDKKDALEGEVRELLQGTVTMKCSKEEKTQCDYQVFADGTLFSTFSLVYEADAWTLDALSLQLQKSTPVLVSVPYGAQLLCNGTPVGEDCISEVRNTDSVRHMPAGSALTGIRYQIYTLLDLYATPQLTIVQNQTTSVPVLNTESGMYEAPFSQPDDSLQETYHAAVLNAAEMLSVYASGDASAAYTRYSIVPGSALDTSFEAGRHAEVAAHYGYVFENTATKDYIAYDETTFSCRVTYDYVLLNGVLEKEALTEHIDRVFYFSTASGTPMLYDVSELDADAQIAGEANK